MKEAIRHNTLPATQHNINLISHFPSSELTVIADAKRLGQVFDNLLSNAIKYTPAGGRVEFSAEEYEAEVTVFVTDTGMGIPADALEHLFEKFYRVQDKEHMEVDGTGLGLFIAKMLIEKHHGEIGARKKRCATTGQEVA